MPVDRQQSPAARLTRYLPKWWDSLARARLTGNLFDGMHSFAIPLTLPKFAVSMSWHPRLDGDAAYRWLRDCVRKYVRQSGRVSKSQQQHPGSRPHQARQGCSLDAVGPASEPLGAFY